MVWDYRTTAINPGPEQQCSPRPPQSQTQSIAQAPSAPAWPHSLWQSTEDLPPVAYSQLFHKESHPPSYEDAQCIETDNDIFKLALIIIP